ncbi:hypothetical protein KW796_02005 [Candidatus Parcubacteria bacterium]|nr:hypothetical protein [Candidatus Parcubacteria bacterium]
MNAKLNEAAQLKASDMAARGYFEHNSPEGKTPWDLFAQVNYEWSWAGEILALNTQTEDNAAIVRGWMNSPEHKKIIMDGSYTETGIGIAIGTYQGQKAVFVAEEFGVPKVPAKSVVPVVIPVVQTQVQTQPKVVEIPKAVTRPVAKRIAAKVIPKAEAQESVTATTTSTVESKTTSAVEPIKLSWFVRLKIFLSHLFTFSPNWVG